MLHGVIHLMGFAKGFGYADLSHLTLPISRGSGELCFVAAGLMVATAATIAVGTPTYLMVGGMRCSRRNW